MLGVKENQTYVMLQRHNISCVLLCVFVWKSKNVKCFPDGDWKMARKQKQSPLHILEPVDLKVVFSRAMVVTDSRMAK